MGPRMILALLATVVAVGCQSNSAPTTTTTTENAPSRQVASEGSLTEAGRQGDSRVGSKN